MKSIWSRDIKQAAVLFVLILVAMTIHQKPLTNDFIVALELYGTREKLALLMKEMDPATLVQTFRIHVAYDFVMMLSYVNLLWRWLFFVHKHETENGLKKMGSMLPYLLLMAGMLDALEDYLMYQYLVKGLWVADWWYISAIKFVFIVSVIMYILQHMIKSIKKAHP